MTRSVFKTKSVEHVAKLIDEYFARCKKRREIISLTGLAIALGTTRKTLSEYKNTDRFGELLQQAKLRCENDLEKRLISGIPASGVIFILKNSYGWKDKVEINQNLTGTISLSKLYTQAESLKVLGDTQKVVDGEIFEIPTIEVENTSKKGSEAESKDSVLSEKALPSNLF